MARFRHRVTDADLVAYVDEEAGGASRAEIEAWLSEHPADAARVETWRRQGDIIRAAFSGVAAEPVPAALSVTQPRRVRPEADAPPLREPSDAPIRRVVPLPRRKTASKARTAITVITLAAGGGLALYVGAVVSGHFTLADFLEPAAGAYQTEVSALAGDRTQELARRAGEAHRAYASGSARPGELAPAGDPTLATWLSQRIGAPVPVPDFSADGLTLLGARITPGELGPAAFLLYASTAGDRIGLFVARRIGDELTNPTYREDRGAAILAWTRPGVGFALTASASRDHLLRLWRRMQAK